MPIGSKEIWKEKKKGEKKVIIINSETISSYTVACKQHTTLPLIFNEQMTVEIMFSITAWVLSHFTPVGLVFETAIAVTLELATMTGSWSTVHVDYAGSQRGGGKSQCRKPLTDKILSEYFDH